MIPVNPAFTRPVLVMGMERRAFLTLLFTSLIWFVLGAITLDRGLIFVIILLCGMSILRVVADEDPLFFAIWCRRMRRNWPFVISFSLQSDPKQPHFVTRTLKPNDDGGFTWVPAPIVGGLHRIAGGIVTIIMGGLVWWIFTA
ncbi:VirB3 family type IV secretion system protein [Cognatishimia sp. D5M38]|uniref:VirB3 family type IV secretion system protein n=1 Tax=Cognatishimia coralii TaxID=3083254 RepID=A0ABU8QKQ9_9RHOB